MWCKVVEAGIGMVMETEFNVSCQLDTCIFKLL